MKRFFFLIFLISHLNAGSSSGFSLGGSVLQREISKDRFSLIYACSTPFFKQRARRILLKEASALTLEKGFRYFSVVEETEVVLAKKGNEYAELPKNLYQERIIEEGNPPSRGAKAEDIPKQDLCKGYKIEVRCFRKRERGMKEPCRYVNCQKREGL